MDLDDSEKYSILMATLAIFLTVYRYFRSTTGEPELFHDMEKVWMPIGDAVLEGQPLYLGVAQDNKPPLFELLNVAAASTGYHILVMYLLVGLCNAIAAVLLFRWLLKRESKQVAYLAPLLFAGFLPVVNGTIVNVRSFALVWILGALLTQSPYRQGAYLGVATMFCQYSVFAIPVVAFYHGNYRNANWWWRYSLSGLLVGIVSFLPLVVIWDQRVLWAGIENTFFSFGSYAIEMQTTNPFINPYGYFITIAAVVTSIALVLIPAALSIVKRTAFSAQNRIYFAFMVFLGLPLLVKSIRYYWMLPLPFISTLAAIEIESWSSRQ